jgi:hypothetical protein
VGEEDSHLNAAKKATYHDPPELHSVEGSYREIAAARYIDM